MKTLRTGHLGGGFCPLLCTRRLSVIRFKWAQHGLHVWIGDGRHKSSSCPRLHAAQTQESVVSGVASCYMLAVQTNKSTIIVDWNGVFGE
jgi:hypothetical protein